MGIVSSSATLQTPVESSTAQLTSLMHSSQMSLTHNVSMHSCFSSPVHICECLRHLFHNMSCYKYIAFVEQHVFPSLPK